jgi:putative addiction module component (TIGR02574 family)
MSTLLERLREQAKELSDDERCILGAELLEPVNGEEAAEIEKAWDEEILRRVEEIRSGKVQMIPMEEVFTELDQMLQCRRQ